MEKNLDDLAKKVYSLISQGKYKETILVAQEIIQEGFDQENIKSLLTAYLQTGVAYYYLGDIEKAFEHLNHYSELCEQQGEEILKLNTFTILFLLHEACGHLDQAKDVLDQTILLGNQFKTYNMISNAYSNYAHLYLKENDYVQAIEMCKKAISVATKHTPFNPLLFIRPKLNWAKGYIGIQEYLTAKQIIDEIDNEECLKQYPREFAQFYDLKGYWHKAQDNFEEALLCFIEAKKIVDTYDDLSFLKTIIEQICELYELLQDIEKGFAAQKEYIKILEEINRKEWEKVILNNELKWNIKDLKEKTYKDSLTNVYNRRYLEEEVCKWFHLKDSLENISCILIDIDYFKEINDTYGHLAGDEVLAKVATVIAKQLCDQSVVVRYGGDEFIVLLKDASKEVTLALATEILLKVRNLRFESNTELSVTLSIGTSQSKQNKVTDLKTLIEHADQALYVSKANGRNQIC